MRYSVKGGSPDKIVTECIVVSIWGNGSLSDEAKILDIKTIKLISGLVNSGDASGNLGDTMLVYRPPNLSAKRILLAGAGDRKKFNASSAKKLIESVFKSCRKIDALSIHLCFSSCEPYDRDKHWLAARISQEAEVAGYSYDKTKSKKIKPWAIKGISISPEPRRQKKGLESSLK